MSGRAEQPELAEAMDGGEELSIDDVESSLKSELEGVTLVGEIDLDHWGPIAEEALLSREHYSAPTLGRRWPATLVTYLVYEGIHKYDESTFWGKVSIDHLRRGMEVGPVFQKALETLHLETFPDLEEREGIGLHTRGRYIRRIHLHGGIPGNAIGNVLDLLASTLRGGARSAEEVVERWLSLDLYQHFHSKAAERIFVHTGDFGVALVDQLIELLRVANRGGDVHLDGIPSHLVEGVMAYLEQDTHGHAFTFVVGPRVRLDLATHESNLVVPPGRDVRWSVGDTHLGSSSRQVEKSWRLPPPDGSGWEVDEDNGAKHVHRFWTAGAPTGVVVFDERGRLHRGRRVLGGSRAYVVAPKGVAVSAAIDSTPIDGWDGFVCWQCDLRGVKRLAIVAATGTAAELPVDASLDVELTGSLVDGVTTRTGLPVFGSDVQLAFRGFVPEPHGIALAIDGDLHALDELPDLDGAFDLAGIVPIGGSERATVEVFRDGETIDRFEFARIPGLRASRPTLASPNESVEVVLHIDRRTTQDVVVNVAAGRDDAYVSLKDGDHSHSLRVTIDRLEWSVEGPHTVVPIAGTNQFSLRRDELRQTRLHLRTAGVPVKVALVNADVVHEERVRRDRHHPGMAVFELRSFNESVSASGHARLEVAVLVDGTEPMPIGYIETRYEPLGIAVEHISGDGLTLVEVAWKELTAWPNRVVRLWAPYENKPIATQEVDDFATAAQFELPELPMGVYFVEVAAGAGWGTVRRPSVGPGCAAFTIGDVDARRLRAAVLRGDRTERFDADALDELATVLADLVVEIMPRGPGGLDGEPIEPLAGLVEAPIEVATTRGQQRTALMERIADDHSRVIEVIDELADRFLVREDGDGRERLEPLLIELMPLLFDYPIRDAEEVPAVRLEHLWVVAPLAAACLDAARRDQRCHERWDEATGATTRSGRDVRQSLDRIIERLTRGPRVQVVSGSRWASARLTGRIEVVPDDPEERKKPLARGSWLEALGALEERQALFSSQSLRGITSHLAKTLEDRRPQGSSPRWSGIVRRTREAVASFGDAGQEMGDLVVLALAHLDPESARRPDEVLRALLASYHEQPDAARNALLLAAASLRILEDAGQLTTLMR